MHADELHNLYFEHIFEFSNSLTSPFIFNFDELNTFHHI